MVGAHYDRQCRSVPIVRLDNVGTEQTSNDCGSASEENVTTQVVRIIAAGLAIDAATGEKPGMVDQV